jgi:hypothetical protein
LIDDNYDDELGVVRSGGNFREPARPPEHQKSQGRDQDYGRDEEPSSAQSL